MVLTMEQVQEKHGSVFQVNGLYLEYDAKTQKCVAVKTLEEIRAEEEEEEGINIPELEPFTGF
jgi:hypothetical protein